MRPVNVIMYVHAYYMILRARKMYIILLLSTYIYILPAHDFVREQHPAHFWILVLTLVNDGLQNKGKKIKTFVRNKRIHVSHTH